MQPLHEAVLRRPLDARGAVLDDFEMEGQLMRVPVGPIAEVWPHVRSPQGRPPVSQVGRSSVHKSRHMHWESKARSTVC